MVYLTAFLLGFLGSFHCVGMCGPIAMSLPAVGSNKWALIAGKFIYNTGRIITYSLMGLVVGLIGHRFAMAGFQKYLSVGAGVLILLSVGLFAFGNQHRPNVFNSWLLQYTSKIKALFRQLFGLRSHATLLGIGMVNGLLPCGFVYLALAGALADGGGLQLFGVNLSGMVYMLCFGLGTLPAMLSLSLFGGFLGSRFKGGIRRATPYIAIIVALFLIYRGFAIHQHDCCRDVAPVSRTVSFR